MRAETALAETMKEMRSWLDKHQVQPIEFKIARTGLPGIAFDVQFRSEDEAVLFEQICLVTSRRCVEGRTNAILKIRSAPLSSQRHLEQKDHRRIAPDRCADLHSRDHHQRRI
jgi:hypothetical protein